MLNLFKKKNKPEPNNPPDQLTEQQILRAVYTAIKSHSDIEDQKRYNYLKSIKDNSDVTTPLGLKEELKYLEYKLGKNGNG